jgi:hypothetical protein
VIGCLQHSFVARESFAPKPFEGMMKKALENFGLGLTWHIALKEASKCGSSAS